MSGESTHLVAQTTLPGAAAVLALAAAILTIAISAYALRRLPLTRYRTLLGLRTLGVLCALVLYFQPALRSDRLATMPSRIVVLLDDSASMSLPAEDKAKTTRFDRALALARDATSTLKSDHLDRRIELYTLSHTTGPDHADAAPVALPPGIRPRTDGATTRLFESLTALSSGSDRDLAGVVLLSDGADHGRLGSMVAELDDATRAALGKLQAPINTITVGKSDVHDLVVGKIAHDDFGFVRTPVTFEVEVRALGAEPWAGRSVPVTLRRDGVVIATESIRLGSNGTLHHIMFRHVPERTGEFVFDVSVPVQDGELTAANNIARFSLRVVRDRVRVLQVAGQPSWDERFLRSFFKRDPNVDLISFFILRTPTSIEVATRDELSLIEFPTDELFRKSLDTFDLVVMQNFNYGPYQMEAYLPDIRRYVEGGGALAMLGGELSFDAGGYAGTPIEALLPVELGLSTTKDNAIDPRPVHPRLTAAGRVHPLTALALDVDESARIFSALPAFDGVNLVRRARPDATVLAVHPTLLDQDHQPLPVIAVREVGRGRVLTVGSDSTWRWTFEGASHDGPRHPYERFWESAVRWLVRDPALSLLRLEVDRAGPGLARVTAVGPDYKPVPGAKIVFSLSKIPDPSATGGEEIVSGPTAGETDALGKLTRPLPSLGVGAYRLRATTTLSGRPIEDQALFVLGGEQDELADPAARPALMAAIAKATDGEARSIDQGLKGLSFAAPRQLRIAASEDRPLWTSPFVFFIGLSALICAWALGRRWGRR